MHEVRTSSKLRSAKLPQNHEYFNWSIDDLKLVGVTDINNGLPDQQAPLGTGSKLERSLSGDTIRSNRDIIRSLRFVKSYMEEHTLEPAEMHNFIKLVIEDEVRKYELSESIIQRLLST